MVPEGCSQRMRRRHRSERDGHPYAVREPSKGWEGCTHPAIADALRVSMDTAKQPHGPSLGLTGTPMRPDGCWQAGRRSPPCREMRTAMRPQGREDRRGRIHPSGEKAMDMSPDRFRQARDGCTAPPAAPDHAPSSTRASTVRAAAIHEEGLSPRGPRRGLPGIPSGTSLVTGYSASMPAGASKPASAASSLTWASRVQGSPLGSMPASPSAPTGGRYERRIHRREGNRVLSGHRWVVGGVVDGRAARPRAAGDRGAGCDDRRDPHDHRPPGAHQARVPELPSGRKEPRVARLLAHD